MFKRQKSNIIDTHHEEVFLQNIFSQSVINFLGNHGAFVAGGCIRSLFTNQDINDIDIFFRDYTSYALTRKMFDDCDSFKVICTTDRAKTYISDETYNKHHPNKDIVYGPSYLSENKIKIQLVCLQFDEPMDAIRKFDFRCCMAAYDYQEKEFHFDENFFSDNARRILVFNPNCCYPLSTLFRVQKFQKRGYTITDESLLLITLTLTQQPIDTYQDLLSELKGIPMNRAIRNVLSPNDLRPWSKSDSSKLKQRIDVEEVQGWLNMDFSLVDNKTANESKEANIKYNKV